MREVCGRWASCTLSLSPFLSEASLPFPFFFLSALLPQPPFSLSPSSASPPVLCAAFFSFPITSSALPASNPAQHERPCPETVNVRAQAPQAHRTQPTAQGGSGAPTDTGQRGEQKVGFTRPSIPLASSPNSPIRHSLINYCKSTPDHLVSFAFLSSPPTIPAPGWSFGCPVIWFKDIRAVPGSFSHLGALLSYSSS